MSTPMPPPASTTRTWPAVVAVMLIAVIVGLAAAYLITNIGRSPTDTADPDAIRLEAVTYRSTSPFTDTLIDASDDEIITLASTAGASPDEPLTGTITGDTSRLYATREQPICNTQTLVDTLATDTTLRAAWATAAAITPDTVDATIASLTPVILRTDTAVTNHIYTDGSPTAYQAILQTGTPVLVDQFGQPRVQCSCGNPLLAPAPPEQRPTTTNGDPWASFTPERVTEIAPAPAPAPQLTTVDSTTGTDTTVPTGPNVSIDGTLFAMEDGVSAVTAAGEVVKVLDQRVDAITDDGAGGLIYTLYQHPVDSWTNVRKTGDAAGIWHLRAGATEAEQIVTPAPGSWHLLLGSHQVGNRRLLMYSQLSVTYEQDPTGSNTGGLIVRDLADNSDTMLIEQAFGYEDSIGTVSAGGGKIAIPAGYSDPAWMFFDETLTQITSACDGDSTESLGVLCPWDGVLDDSGSIAALSDDFDATGDGDETQAVLFVDPATAEISNPTRIGLGHNDADHHADPAQIAGGRFVVRQWFGDAAMTTAAFDLTTGEFIEPPNSGSMTQVDAIHVLRAPIIRPAVQPEPSSPPPTSSSPEPAALLTYDEVRAAFPSTICDLDFGTLQLDPDGYGWNGTDTDEDFLTVNLEESRYTQTDVDGDGELEVVVAPVCNRSGARPGDYGRLVELVRADDGSIAVVGDALEGFGGARWTADLLGPTGHGVTIQGQVWRDDDPGCCPSGEHSTTWRKRNSTWERG